MLLREVNYRSIIGLCLSPSFGRGGDVAQTQHGQRSPLMVPEALLHGDALLLVGPCRRDIPLLGQDQREG